ncbi:DUF3775 domain-containing protein [Tateyamaria sp. ANG-S1]|uniref:DUF3775 domain-containing protein n=1 Tax=Tateyamaria sp. ANG-S1 TaxID=1577905 RepID=UPI00057D9208|nr:DUF3775 domain-containing protein [Tateyamaria sp. ANG-S1]KIC50008.1 hypothetical protein RA29_10365 [Tateyamaria sp. ANG-S1]
MELEIERAVVAQVVLMGRELERAEAELRGLIDRLDTDEQAELIAIMWVGRGAFEPDDWNEALHTAESEATTPCADYLLGTPHFTDHLEAGMEALGLPLGDDEDALLR